MPKELHPIPLSEWETEHQFTPTPLFAVPLDDLLVKGYAAGKDTDNEKTITVRTLPTGLMSAWRDIKAKANDGKSPLTRVQRITTLHGLTIANHDARIKDIKKLYARAISSVADDMDKQTLKLLETRGDKLTFIHSANQTTSIGILKIIDAPIIELASDLGIHSTRLKLYLSMLSILTIEDARFQKWTRVLKEEVDLFWVYVNHRMKDLRNIE